jgi:putative peptidoglycan lipid II flippase
MLMAHFFGTSTLQSAFVIAFRIPNLFRRLFGEGALGAAFIPVFAEVERQEGRERAQLFFARVLGMLVCVLGLLVGLGILVTWGVEWGCEEGSRWREAMPLMRIMLPYALLICVAAIVSAVLNVRDRFAISSLTPVVLNVVWIAVLAGICPFLPAEGYWRIGTVCWGILIAGAAQIVFQLPELRRVGFNLRFCFTGWRTSEHLRKVLLQMGPASLGIALAQINICVDGWLAFYGASWAPSALEYADRIIYLPLGLFGTAFATVLLPTYSRQVSNNNVPEMVETLEHSLRTLLVVMAPMAVGLIVLAEPIVALIYQRGAFNAQSVCWTARAVMAYAPGLFAFSAAKTVVPIFYAFKDLKTPVYVASWCIVGNFALNLLSVLFLPEGWRHVGIATSTCINALVNTLILLTILKRRGIQMNLRAMCPVTLKTLLAASGMGICAYMSYVYLNALLPNGLSVLIAIIIGGITYLPLIFLLTPQTCKEVLSDFKFKRCKR